MWPQLHNTSGSCLLYVHVVKSALLLINNTHWRRKTLHPKLICRFREFAPYQLWKPLYPNWTAWETLINSKIMPYLSLRHVALNKPQAQRCRKQSREKRGVCVSWQMLNSAACSHRLTTCRKAFTHPTLSLPFFSLLHPLVVRALVLRPSRVSAENQRGHFWLIMSA